ncbi:Inositol polyphosphate 5-phosphatase [Nosema granulosis]|uniref:Inositol polyphosphate 5-phosphatase n=1 Tax=Nosema granulosis TaxID=83296 RepID=A0A9P6GZS3_9MICR|nr:Inositol polyphosphate 5-phosphatase [Nosema granulosis]
MQWIVKVISYNVNNSKKAVDDLESLIGVEVYDLVLISLQEYYWFLKDSNFKNYKFKYHQNVWGLFCLVLSNKPLDILWEKFCFGSFYCGNKGYIKCTINDSFVFISAHLSHGQTNCKRIEELNRIIPKNIDIPFVLAGDLNFRFISENKFYIEKLDQFSPLKKKLGLFEHQIDFPPTYKYKKNSPHFDLSRVPSYCDRIVGRNIKIDSYETNLEVLNSDHRPVMITGSVSKRKLNITAESPKCNYSWVMCFIYNNTLFILILFMLYVILILFMHYAL